MPLKFTNNSIPQIFSSNTFSLRSLLSMSDRIPKANNYYAPRINKPQNIIPIRVLVFIYFYSRAINKLVGIVDPYRHKASIGYT
jgi:hypothetical protein